jgi:hypothetical protein
MKTFKTQILIIALAVSATISGCCKTDDYFVYPDEGKIKTIADSDSKVISTFIYSEDGLITKSATHEYFYMTGENEELNYTYNSDKMLTEKSGFEPGILYMSSMTGAMGKDVVYKYEYDSEKRLSKVTKTYDYGNKYPDLNYTTVATYNYPEEGKIIELFSIVGMAANSTMTTTEYYYNKDRNIETKLILVTIGNEVQRLNTKEEFTYDTKKAPYQVEPTPQSKNNVLSHKSTTYNYSESGVRSEAYSSTFTYSYTYNSLGYPISMSKTLSNGIVELRKFYYE